MSSLYDVEQKCLSFGLTQAQADEVVDLTLGCMVAYVEKLNAEALQKIMGEGIINAVREEKAERQGEGK